MSEKSKTRFSEAREYYNQTHSIRITQDDIADKCSLSKPTISRIESGTTPPSLEALKIYHKMFNVSYEYLLDEAENKESKNVKIGKELQLSDRAINNIKALKSNPHAQKVLNHILMSDDLETFLTSLYVCWNISLYGLLDTEDFMTEKDLSSKVKISKEFPLLLDNDISPKYTAALKLNLEHKIYQFLLDNAFYIDPYDELLND